MDSSAPTITFGTTTGTVTPGSGSWDVTAKIWTQTFTISDANEERTGVSVSSSAAKDVAGNTEGTGTSASFNIDTKNPTGAVTLGTSLIKDSDLTQEVTITYDEAMDSSAPTITFGTTTGTVTPGSGSWDVTAKIWTQTFTISDANEERTGVSVSSSAAKDVAGNTEGTGTSASFNIDTKNPTGAVTLGTSLIKDNDLTQEVTITYDEAMDSSAPTITFGTTTGTVTPGSGSWD